MNQLTDISLARYVLGSAEPGAAQRIEQRLPEDQELRERVQLRRFLASELGMGGDVEEAGPEQARSVQAKRMRRLSIPMLVGRLAAVLLAMLFVGGVSFAGWWLLSPTPLLQDTLQSRAFRSDLWKTPRPTVKPHNEFLSLVNRGYLVTQQEFPGPVSITFEWLWIEPDVYAPQYSELLCVALRTRGVPNEKWPFDITDGAVIGFNAWGNMITVSEAITIGPQKGSGMLSTPMLPEEWHEIRVDDDGSAISVYIKGPRIDKRHWKEPVLQTTRVKHADKHHIAIYNREPVAGVRHESRIRNVKIMPLEK
jgi:hypothetical protein